MSSVKILSSLIVLCLSLGSCTKDFSDQWPYTKPTLLNDGIPVGSLEGVGIDQDLIQHIRGRITYNDMPEIHSVLIMKDDKLVLEEYFDGHEFYIGDDNFHGDEVHWNSQTRHVMMSCTKSITTACIGIAIEQGYISSIHDPIFNYLPNYQNLNNNGRHNITIEHLVTMSSGLAWDEWSQNYADPENDMASLYLPGCSDPVECILNRPVIHSPGTTFTYSGGNSAVLAEIIENATGMTINSFASQYLFSPLGIDSVEWTEVFPNGKINAAGGIKLTPREMIKVGSVFLNDGSWMGSSLIPSSWIANCKASYSNNAGIKVPGEVSGKQGYGYGWWNYEFCEEGGVIYMYNASGWGGQYIMVFDELDMVIVFTGGTYNSDTQAHEMVDRFILPYVQ